MINLVWYRNDLRLHGHGPIWFTRGRYSSENERIRNDSTYWLIFELLWRDFFRFICGKHSDRIFYRSGLQRLTIASKGVRSSQAISTTRLTVSEFRPESFIKGVSLVLR